MTSVLRPEEQAYFEIMRQVPLSETISEAQTLFEGDRNMCLRSVEESVDGKHGWANGRVLGYRDVNEDRLFIYLGVTYNDDSYRFYPSRFFFGTDIDNRKLRVFLEKIQGKTEFFNRMNVLDTTPIVEPGKPVRHTGSPLLTCIDSTRRRKKGLYEDCSGLIIGSSIDDLKEVLDSSN